MKNQSRKANNILLIFFIFIFFELVITNGCSDNNSVNTNETLIYEYTGVLENVGGDCSAVQIRTRSLGVMDLGNSDKIKFTFSGMSDADLSSISIFYINDNDEQINLVNLSDRDQINNTQSIITDSPGINTEIFSRVTLKSSVCTGQIFYLTFSNLKIFKIN